MKRKAAGCLLLIVFLGIDAVAYGATRTLASCSQADVSAAIAAAADGDTIVCPAGSWTWTSQLVLSNKNITWQGAGIDQTNITSGTTNFIEIPTSNTKPFRITGFTFTSTTNMGGTSAMMRVRGGKNWRIDHNKFQIYSSMIGYGGGSGILAQNDVAGVVDHNQFVNNPDQLTSGGCIHNGVYVYGTGLASRDFGPQISSFSHTVFIEDNYFREAKQCSSHNPHAPYAQVGAVYVFRHNEVRNMDIDAHGFEAMIGTREFEVSNNTFVVESGRNIYRIFALRGGTGVIYGNTVSTEGSGTWNYGVSLIDSRVTTNSRGNPARPELYGGVPASSCCTTSEGYPCVDQIGRGQSVGTSPNKSQVLDPLYIWNNNFGVVVQSYGGSECGGAPSTYIQPNRDYYTTGPKPGYTAYPYPHPLTLTAGGTPPPPPPPPTGGLVPNAPSGIQVSP